MGKISFSPDKLIENATVLITSVIKAKPSVAKGKYIKGCYLSSTHGSGDFAGHHADRDGGQGLEGCVPSARLQSPRQPRLSCDALR